MATLLKANTNLLFPSTAILRLTIFSINFYVVDQHISICCLVNALGIYICAAKEKYVKEATPSVEAIPAILH